ncbi:pyrroline-5-carboxylate reductase [Alkalihalophilus marmarensis]|uniref:pyrroline-5-carboxylate reductase n=1 Tax=Alkalihalophilus marmarensis TaxID=521377 RepID=UPI002DBEC016|nr:pyrroline-5-carboxylate reductase [Alkalihalophilus marmarensis]MEC2070625.1 pyrroline-5-carboxylate reductase [Alkalihalophilus marmarensis]
MLTNKTITFLGAGAMAEAIIGGLIRNQIVDPHNIIATNLSDTNKLEKLKMRYNIQTTTSRTWAVEQAEIIVLAMKPKNIEEAVREIKEKINNDKLIISVIAGIPSSYIEDLSGTKSRVVRTMPNTSAKVGASATAICAGRYSTSDDLETVSLLFSAVGTVTVVPEEKMDAVTGVAGSGPAYFYYLIEAMEKAAVESGLTSEEATALITQTVVGVGKRLQDTSKSSRELYEEVMSPNGTTEAGITLLSERNGQDAMHDAILKAIARSKELGSVFTESK